MVLAENTNDYITPINLVIKAVMNLIKKTMDGLVVVLRYLRQTEMRMGGNGMVLEHEA